MKKLFAKIKLLINYLFIIIYINHRITSELVKCSNLSRSNSIHVFENTLEILFLEIFIKKNMPSIEISLRCSNRLAIYLNPLLHRYSRKFFD